ncbi:alkylation response protein AidB-like acyl-CoA dehydrogenase [Nocardiopsis mwathae]|uniref:Alkylation response protein AidB-like acyl-CoA dehydrogenase n=1 Tax=Nocardiopsis mwathae TaxID=1472723 RepID=A0A7W9YHM0_9ACTN|nr:acyl-CoA dehydrogenase family protein [Nocardiopsis mwathae]MBB6172288.1 alkylation response protein AidB-like acyl-CoA dehydrogenase [Nocardiopsis mwathae]
MAFTLSPDQRRFASWARETAEGEFRAAPPPHSGRVDRDLLHRLARCGLLSPLFPGADGGRPSRPASAVELCLLREHLAQVSTAAETALALQGLGAYPLIQSGGTGQAARWIPRVAAGQAVAAFALSEPDAGSDAAALRLAAEPEPGTGPNPGRWRLTGEKTWISNAPDADLYTVFARTGPDAGARGVTAFLVPADRPGLSGEPLDMIAPHALGHLAFDGVPVTRDDLLGAPGRGFRVAMRTLDLFRPSVGAFAVGMAQAALDLAREHTARRHAFGGPLCDLQSVAHTLAEMATRTEAARLLVYAAATARDASATATPAPVPSAATATATAPAPDGPFAGAGDGLSPTARAAMAKLYATETAQYVVDAAVQLHGARALRRGHPLEELYREVRAPRIYEGASEVQRTIIARELYRQC